MASGHVNRANRPNTWLLRPSLLREEIPCQPGAVHTWPKLRRSAAHLPLAEEFVAAYFCAFDRRSPRRVQAILLGALAYFVLPFDFIPDMLPLIGFTDDAAVLVTAIKVVAAHITPEHREAARALLARLRNGERTQPI
jgi:uncharacterized membrane protein YkvA (DUF1232 family)